MDTEKLKEAALADLNNQNNEFYGRVGFAENASTVVTAKVVGYNKPGRTNHIRYIVTNKK
jgi:uncharacterized protein with LGFP repeats